MTAALTVDHVNKTYRSSTGRDVVALDTVSLEIAAGECLAVIGESGSGKSTLARLAMGLETPDSGTLLVNGIDPVDVARGAVSARSAMVMQDPTDSLDPRMKVGRIVAEPLVVGSQRLTRAEREERVVRALRAVGLDERYLGSRPSQLSGGQQQRVGIARALIRDPSFLVLDEPTSALDPSVQAQIMRLIEDLRARLGISALLITHDLAVAAHLADRIAVIRHGVIVEVGNALDVWNDPQHPYTRSLLSAAAYEATDPASAAV